MIWCLLQTKIKQQESIEQDKTIEQTDMKTEVEAKQQEEGTQDTTNVLVSIREEDEHSDYNIEEGNLITVKSDQKPTITDGKRKIVSRQSSTASLRNKSNSVIANSETTIGDSGIGTLDTPFDGSEHREIADIFEFSDDESELGKPASPQETSVGKHAESFDICEEDEDKIDDECVRESLSRVSDVSPLEQYESDEEGGRISKVQMYGTERSDAFVDEYMYFGVDRIPTEEDLAARMQTSMKLTRAQMLQNAILKRANTLPALLHRYVPKPPPTPKTNINGIKCSHIDIDLTCEVPPKADIKSVKQFNRRVQSARSRTKSAYFDPSLLDRKMSVVDMTQIVLEDTFTSDEDASRWPARPITRPKSSHHQRLLPMAWEKDTRPQRPRRAQSATPHVNRRQHSKSPGPQGRHLARPETANLTYSASRRTVPDINCARLEKQGDFTVVTSDPFVKSDKLYPRKTLLTSYHHGFKSIWPIGRNINVLQNKRPFSSFEMNSYSRAIERQEFPFRGDLGLDNKENELKLPKRETSTIKLELEPEGHVKPKIKKLSVLLPCNFTPRTVR